MPFFSALLVAVLSVLAPLSAVAANNGATPPEWRAAEALNRSALARMHRGDDAGAERALTKALALQPGYADARLHLAMVYARSNRLDGARRELETLTAAHPDRPAYERMLLDTLARAGHTTALAARLPAVRRRFGIEAVERAVRAVAEHGRPADALRLLRPYVLGFTWVPSSAVLYAEILLVQGRTREALDLIAQIGAEAPDTAGLDVLRARALLAAGDMMRAKRFLARALVTDPGPAAGVAVALAQAEENWEAVLTNAARARRLGAAGPEPTADEARAWLELGDSRRALRVIDAVVRNHPDDPNARLTKFAVLKRAGRLPAAKAELAVFDRLTAGDARWRALRRAAEQGHGAVGSGPRAAGDVLLP